MNADTREWWVIQDGQIRFTIDGQQPFVASKGYLVQVPYRNMYTMETVGDRPSLRFEVNVAKARKMYPMDVKPVPVAGFDFVPVRVPGKGTYVEGNKPFVDFNAVAAGTDKTRRFVHDDRAVANIILGRGIPPPPLTNRGHFHPESAEFWFILLGKIRYNIEGLKVFEADQGDIVYVPKQRFHLASFAGDADSCRLAMNGYTDLSHSYEAENAPARTR
jgi:quercetin dioxygenase-like cupin family protein